MLTRTETWATDATHTHTHIIFIHYRRWNPVLISVRLPPGGDKVPPVQRLTPNTNGSNEVILQNCPGCQHHSPVHRPWSGCGVNRIRRCSIFIAPFMLITSQEETGSISSVPLAVIGFKVKPHHVGSLRNIPPTFLPPLSAFADKLLFEAESGPWRLTSAVD